MVATCRAIVKEVVGHGVEEEDRKRTWMADAGAWVCGGWARERARSFVSCLWLGWVGPGVGLGQGQIWSSFFLLLFLGGRMVGERPLGAGRVSWGLHGARCGVKRVNFLYVCGGVERLG